MGPPVNAIGIQFHGRLGNHMFQYAAARLLADRLNCWLLIAGRKLGREPGLLKHWFRTRRPPEVEWSELGILRRAFGVGPGVVRARLTQRHMGTLREWLFPRTFSPKTVRLADDIEAEMFDEALFAQQPGTWLSGYFQSARYFGESAGQVREMFQPSARQLDEMQLAMRAWHAPPAETAAVHIRRGDYLRTRGPLGHPDEGMMLPFGYYRDALARIPGSTPLAIFSDDPDWAERQFSGHTAWVSRDKAPALDMLLMAQCRWVIAANSSFSWWGAWLNTCPEHEVFAPLHHLGWRLGQWHPRDIDVPEWTYIRATR